MSNDLAAAAEESVERFTYRMSMIDSRLDRMGIEVQTGMYDQTTRKLVDLSGLAAYTQQSPDGSAPLPDAVQYKGKAFEDVTYEKRVTVTEREYAKNPQIFNNLADLMADRAEHGLFNLVHSLLSSLDTTEHPDSTYTATGGGTVYYADDFATPNSQTNVITLPFTRETLPTGKSYLRQWLNKDGLPIDYADDPLVVVCHADLEQDVRDIVALSMPTYDGTGLANSGAWGISGIVVNPLATDTNDVLLMTSNKARNPFKLWLSRAPVFRPEVLFPGAGRYEVYSAFDAVAMYAPFEGGFVLYKVS